MSTVRRAKSLVAVWLLLLLVGSAVGSLVTDAHPGFDQSIVNALRSTDDHALTSVMRAMTWLGSTVWLNLCFFAALLGLVIKLRWRAAGFLVLASPGTVLLVQIVKAVVGRARPLGPHLTSAGGFSWPSGHASSSAALYGAILLLALRSDLLARPMVRRVAAAAVITLLVLIGASRVFLGVHFPSDVLAAWLLVGVWLSALSRCVSLDAVWHRRGGAYPVVPAGRDAGEPSDEAAAPTPQKLRGHSP